MSTASEIGRFSWVKSDSSWRIPSSKTEQSFCTRSVTKWFRPSTTDRFRLMTSIPTSNVGVCTWGGACARSGSLDGRRARRRAPARAAGRTRTLRALGLAGAEADLDSGPRHLHLELAVLEAGKRRVAQPVAAAQVGGELLQRVLDSERRQHVLVEAARQLRELAEDVVVDEAGIPVGLALVDLEGEHLVRVLRYVIRHLVAVTAAELDPDRAHRHHRRARRLLLLELLRGLDERVQHRVAALGGHASQRAARLVRIAREVHELRRPVARRPKRVLGGVGQAADEADERLEQVEPVERARGLARVHEDDQREGAAVEDESRDVAGEAVLEEGDLLGGEPLDRGALVVRHDDAHGAELGGLGRGGFRGLEEKDGEERDRGHQSLFYVPGGRLPVIIHYRFGRPAPSTERRTSWRAPPS